MLDSDFVKSRNIGENTQIGAYSIVEKGAVIGEKCQIGCYCYIDNDVVIGNGVIIRNGTYIYKNTRIEEYSQIGSYVVIGDCTDVEENGITIIGKKSVIPPRCVINCGSIVSADNNLKPCDVIDKKHT